jgi:AraC-like DNA-binding protein
MEVLKATYITHAFSRHSHESYAIGAIMAGVETFAYRGGTHHAAAGTLLVIHPGEVHTGYAGAQEGWQYRMIYPPVALIQQAAGEMGLPQSHIPFFPTTLTDPTLVAEFVALHRSLEQSASPLERESRLLLWLARLVHRYGVWRSPCAECHRDQGIAQQVQTYLQDHYAETITLKDLSETVNMPPLKLLRLCRRELGLPPHRYLIQLRVRQAKHKIAAGMPLSLVAADTGFADQSHLTRHFKRLVGATPGQYQAGC